MSDLSNILKSLMNEVKITVTELARQTGIGQPVIHRMASRETDNPKVGSLIPIAAFFNINVSQLMGVEPLPSGRIPGSHNPFYRHWNRLHLLSWEQAARFPDDLVLSEISSFVCTDSNVSPYAFAIRTEDSTMATRFPEGTLLIIEPTIKARNNDFAAVLVDGESKIQFKQLLFDGEDLYLKPLNPDFEIKRVGKNHRIVGVMVQSITEFYQDRLPAPEIEYISHKPPVKKRRDKTTADEEN